MAEVVGALKGPGGTVGRTGDVTLIAWFHLSQLWSNLRINTLLTDEHVSISGTMGTRNLSYWR